ncbi:CDP-diacylglycerol--glycerol-3-phosphate 3-phosphatidyltransferase [Mycoplasma struthionis]|uniref:CDP-diacylglycerol--glycerol-3-phosphate 3-phosphatidyltransferase n=1 Tax=Mycoplasma struthionis TaxID=538220 RepID=A0A3G8LHM0_9MOLU|nr:CDP-diacylglycerol--glycerol-3-phosphate 3-phosphatidyltransferase [Mycoplasma struthionis]AZG68837.1 CDP-diacylglycerol--glycerol-3-phosphate 3-phosphatidyltransferase [Mycoplasma struthionis]TPI01501.1 CDP-diacylglycerol--glycerol-3-phosphate 3-phosphatidyltransferase [Mycoplasma struthionis]
MNNQKTTKFGLANWLTIIRILLMIPFLITMTISYVYVIEYNTVFHYDKLTIVSENPHKELLAALHWTNFIIFSLAMITDFIDGWYARRTKTVSNFGKIFDPIADKVATVLMLVYLAIMRFTFFPIVIIFSLRDILVDGARIYAIKKNITVQANWWGKAKTIVVSFSLVFLSVAGPWLASPTLVNNSNLITFYLNIPLIIGAVLSVISGIIYMKKYLKNITKEALIK